MLPYRANRPLARVGQGIPLSQTGTAKGSHGVGHYVANVQDLKFNLFEVLGLGRVLGEGDYLDLDLDTAATMLEEAARLAEGPVAESFTDADRNPPEFLVDEHTIAVPAPLAKTVQALKDSDWWRVGLPEGLGGVPAPPPLAWAINEMLTAANPAAYFLNLGPAMALSLYSVGTPQQRQWAKVALERGWTGTMVLTEPDAGSDVGACSTKAVPQPDGTWHLHGVKRFISGGDVGDTAENIFHLVLARPEGAGPGTKGLSLFYVPKYLFDPDTLELGPRNGVFVTGVEHKMGLKSSPTCELAFGISDTPAVGYLVGDVHNGIAQMFNVMESARMWVGIKAAGTLSTGYLNALEFAKQRIQGPELMHITDKTAPRVSIIHHPDVRRSLMTQKAYAEGLRSLYLYTAAHQDPVLAEQVSGADPNLAARVGDLLLPIVKGVSSERAYQILSESLQTLGGSGFLSDYPIEQYIRDAKIDSLYEGTTAIQSLDFIFRKIVRDGGVTLNHVFAQIRRTIDGCSPDLRPQADLLSAALEDVQAMVSTLTEYLMASQNNASEINKVGLASVPFLLAVGDLFIGWRLLENADVAQKALATDIAPGQRPFYLGKVAVASFFANTMLRHLSASRDAIAALDNDIMDVPEAAF